MIGLRSRTRNDIEHGLPGDSLEPFLIGGAFVTGALSILYQAPFEWTWGTLGWFILNTIIGYGIQWLLWTAPKEMHYSTRLAFSWLCLLIAMFVGMLLAGLRTML